MKQPDLGMGTSWIKRISQFDWPTGDSSFQSKQISVHTRELAPETDSCNGYGPGACSLISNQFDMREPAKLRSDHNLAGGEFVLVGGELDLVAGELDQVQSK